MRNRFKRDPQDAPASQMNTEIKTTAPASARWMHTWESLTEKPLGLFHSLNENAKRKRLLISLLSFFIPVICMLIAYAFLGIFPFGGKSILTVDLNGQYISFFSYYKEILKGNADIFYTFSKSLGGDMAGLFAYYLASPLNILFVFFPTDRLPDAVLLLTLIKVGLSGLTMSYLLNRICIQRGQKPRFLTLVFSLSYAMMAYNVVYQQNIMWLDGVILLPLIIASIDKILEGKRIFAYSISLGLAIITNYYIGFMLCIFSVMYFAFRLISSVNWKEEGRIRICFRHAWRFAAGSLLAGGLSAFLLLPALSSLSGGKADFSVSALTFDLNFNLYKLIFQAFLGDFNWSSLSAGLPNLYCGGVIFIGLFLYYASKKVSLKEKIMSALVLLALIGSFYINAFNLIWHGFNPPVSFIFRYSFLFSFFVILLSFQGMTNTKEETKRPWLMPLIALGIYIVMAAVVYFTMENSPLDLGKIALSVMLVTILCVLVYLYFIGKRRLTYLALALMLLVNGTDVTLNATLSLQNLPYQPRAEYMEYVDAVSSVIGRIEADDDSFYRLEKTFQRTTNDSSLFNYRGLSHFSSSEKVDTKDFLGRMGFRNYQIWSYYNTGSTIAVDSLLGVKYLLAKPLIHSQYDELFTENGITAYENPYVLPLGFMVNSDIREIDLMADANLFNLQNSIFADATRKEGSDTNRYDWIFEREKNIKLRLKNLKQDEEGNGYTVIDETKEAYAEFTIRSDKNSPLYFYLPTITTRPAEMFVNGKSFGVYFDVYFYGIVPLGEFKKGETVTIRMVPQKGKINFDGKGLFYYQNMNTFQKYIKDLRSLPFEPESADSSHYFKGSVTSKRGRDCLLLSIPYEESWRIRIDGEVVEGEQVLGALTLVEVPEGTHEIELFFAPKGFLSGSILTLSCVLLIIVLYFISRRKERLTNDSEEEQIESGE